MQWTHWFAGLIDAAAGRPHVQLPADVSQRRRRGGDRRGAGRRRLGGDPRAVSRPAASGTISPTGTAPCSSISASCAAISSTAAPHPRETQHRLRLCCGNGLRADVWEPFQQRFHIPQILEFYAATEGSFSLLQLRGQAGRDRPDPAFPGASLSGGADQVRHRDRRAGAQRGRASASAARADEVGRGDRPDSRTTARRLRGQFEGYTDTARQRAEGAARRLRRRATPGIAPAI